MKVYETVVRKRAGGKDRYGDPLPGPPDLPIAGVRVAPLDTRENTNAANTVVTGYTLQMPPGSDVKPADVLEVRGLDCAVVGLPFDAARKGLLVTVEGVTG